MVGTVTPVFMRTHPLTDDRIRKVGEQVPEVRQDDDSSAFTLNAFSEGRILEQGFV